MSVQTMAERDLEFMHAALDMAREALERGEFPVGCVIAGDTGVVASGRRSGTLRGAVNEIDHAEINALRRLDEAEPRAERSRLSIYCTMEPCLMCLSAIILSGISRVVYAYEDVMGGGARCDRSGLAPLYRDAQLTVIGGVLRESSLSLFQDFFNLPDNAYWPDSLLSRYTLSQTLTT